METCSDGGVCLREAKVLFSSFSGIHRNSIKFESTEWFESDRGGSALNCPTYALKLSDRNLKLTSVVFTGLARFGDAAAKRFPLPWIRMDCFIKTAFAASVLLLISSA